MDWTIFVEPRPAKFDNPRVGKHDDCPNMISPLRRKEQMMLFESPAFRLQAFYPWSKRAHLSSHTASHRYARLFSSPFSV